VADILGVGSVPTRDALLQLETEGLVVRKASGRYAVSLSESDVHYLYEARSIMESGAARLAATRISPEGRESLMAQLEEMAEAVAHEDAERYIHADLELHRRIWRISENRYLYQALDALAGLLFMLMSWDVRSFDWTSTLGAHRELVAAIASGDPCAAAASVDQNMEAARRTATLLAAST
jgi:DNA-binding GntR family transcriptional regulator